MKFFNSYRKYVLFDEAQPAEGAKGGGGGADTLESIKAELASLKAELAKSKGGEAPKPNDPPKDDDDLSKKIERERQDKDKKMSETKQIETAVRFNTQLPEWIKTNKSLLPESVNDILVQADKENFNSEVEKSNAIKVGIINQFYALQSNLDLLTESQKKSLDDFKALTKAERELRVQSIYENIFEPSFLTLKNIERAKKISKGHAETDDKHSAYVQKMIELSSKKYKGVK